MDKPELVVSRELLTRADSLACSVVDDDTLSDDSRDDAEGLHFAISELLLHWGHNPDQSVRLIPMGFELPQFYTQMAEKLLADLGGEHIEAQCPAYVAMARRSRLVDNALYSDDFRVDALSSLNEVLACLNRRLADEDDTTDSRKGREVETEEYRDSFEKLTVQRTARIPEITPDGVRYRYRFWREEPEQKD